jgi:hypothetical protein
MAPELWGTATVSFSKAIDIYAFGVTALALLNAVVPKGLEQEPPLPVVRTALNATFGALASDVADMIFACLDPSPAARPSMTVIQQILGRHLLRDQHRALVVMNGKQASLE